MPQFALRRRGLLKLALAGLAAPLAGALPQSVLAQAAAGRSSSETGFNRATLVEMARALAAKPYIHAAAPALGALAGVTPEQATAIRYRDGDRPWASAALPFAIEPLHRTRSLPGEVELYLVEAGKATRLGYDAARFEFGSVKPPPASANLGFTGFRVLRRLRDGALTPVFSLRNASFFSAISRGQAWGPLGRPLTVRTADQKGEEAPQFKSVYIERPGPASTALVLHGLIDSPSLTAACTFTLRADEATVIDTECTIFARNAVEHLGVAPVQASSYVGPLDRRSADDYRPAAYEVGGVQMLTGGGEWIWRPVNGREQLQVSAFVDRDPRGFGLIQRQRDFAAFLDDENDWHRRPSVWIEPIGGWGAGEVTLMELPAASHINKNIACYWRPKPGLAAGAQAHFAFRQFWSWGPPERPDGAVVTATTLGRIPGASTDSRRRFLVQFQGEALGDAAKAAAFEPKVWASAGKIAAIRLFKTPHDSSLRVVFDLDTGNHSLIELRLALTNNGAPASETWLYRWTP